MKTVALMGVSFLVLVSIVDGQSTAGVKCHVCMGRDSDNCVYGEANCPGYCYKVVDKGHDLIAKGCTTEKDLPTNTEVADWAPIPHIKLYWTNKNEKGEREHISGRSYFCTSAFCNAASNLGGDKVLGLLIALLSMLTTGFMLRL
jgi:hypothetical protein